MTYEPDLYTKSKPYGRSSGLQMNHEKNDSHEVVFISQKFKTLTHGAYESVQTHCALLNLN